KAIVFVAFMLLGMWGFELFSRWMALPEIKIEA
ncbi:MAG: hypothetical protein RLY90_1509, partial [Pseudomonadota bacterium]